MPLKFVQLHLYNKARIVLRLIAPLGIFRMIFLAVILLLLANKAFEISSFSLPLCFGAISLFYHTNRQDKFFLSTLVPSTYYLYCAEYLCIAIPFMLIAICKGSIFSVLLYLFLACLIPLTVDLGISRFSLPIFTMPGQLKGAYMYGIGFRKTIFPMLIAYVCAIYFVYSQQLIQYCVAVTCLGYLIALIQMLPTNRFYLQKYVGFIQYCRLNIWFILAHSSLLFMPIFLLSLLYYQASIQYVALLYVAILVLSVIYHQCAIVLNNVLLQSILSIIYAVLLTTVFIKIWMGIIYLLLWTPLTIKTYSKLRQLYDRN